MDGKCNSKICWVPAPWRLGEGQRSNIFKSQLLSQFEIFLNQTLCVFSQMKDIKYIRLDFHWVPWVMPKGLGLGGAGGQKFNFQNMAMWHIKLKGMNSSPGYTENVYPAIKLVSLGWGQRVNYHWISSRAWGFAMTRHQMCSSYLLNHPRTQLEHMKHCRIYRG